MTGLSSNANFIYVKQMYDKDGCRIEVSQILVFFSADAGQSSCVHSDNLWVKVNARFTRKVDNKYLLKKIALLKNDKC